MRSKNIFYDLYTLVYTSFRGHECANHEGMNQPSDYTISHRFFTPLNDALQDAKSTRHCPTFSDLEFLRSGVGRVLTPVRSGREWVQRLQMTLNCSLTVNHFFASLKSDRRLRLLEEVNNSITGEIDAGIAHSKKDPLALIPELDAYAVYASDGHFESAATHAKPLFGKIRAVAGFYSINLRTRSLRLLDIARPRGIKSKEHDITALKRLGSTALRLGEPKGTKVIHVYDPAIVDYWAWDRWKAKGVYIVTREKKNSAADIQGVLEWARDDPRNNGVVSDHLVAPGAGHLLRRVVYRDPASGTEYTFLTNVLDVPPGVIAFLYKLRWDIEKTFDEKKNKLDEKKAWATSETAFCQQAQFVCITYNLMTLLELELEEQEDIRDDKIQRRRQKHGAEVAALIEENKTKPNALVAGHHRATQRSLQFIRWLRHCIETSTSWTEGVVLLRPYMANYIS
jgi:hypothetical protein